MTDRPAEAVDILEAFKVKNDDGNRCESGFWQCQVCTDRRCPERNPGTVDALFGVGADRVGSTLGATHPSKEIAGLIDHTLLKPDATGKELKILCQEAAKFGFASVCVNPVNVAFCVKKLKGTDIPVATVIGFPLGANTTRIKAEEATLAVSEGAEELDMVMNIGALKSSAYDFVEEDIRAVVSAANGKTVKVIIETALLEDEEKIKASMIAKAAGAKFVKTSTGFSSGGATIEDVALMRRVVGPGVGVKASGGIKTFEDAMKMVESGANRIGASASVQIASGSSS